MAISHGWYWFNSVYEHNNQTDDNSVFVYCTYCCYTEHNLAAHKMLSIGVGVPQWLHVIVKPLPTLLPMSGRWLAKTNGSYTLLTLRYTTIVIYSVVLLADTASQ